MVALTTGTYIEMPFKPTTTKLTKSTRYRHMLTLQDETSSPYMRNMNAVIASRGQDYGIWMQEILCSTRTPQPDLHAKLLFTPIPGQGSVCGVLTPKSPLTA